MYYFLPMLHAVAKVGLEMQNYVLMEGNLSTVCVVHSGTLEKPISTNYSLTYTMGYQGTLQWV